MWLKNFPDSSICDIYYFTTSEVTAKERYEILKAYDTSNDYTYYLSDEENMENCISIVKIINLLKEQCLKFDIPYFKTLNNRKDVINSFVKSFSE